VETFSDELFVDYLIKSWREAADFFFGRQPSMSVMNFLIGKLYEIFLSAFPSADRFPFCLAQPM
jgi:hypothetical protein